MTDAAAEWCRRAIGFFLAGDYEAGMLYFTEYTHAYTDTRTPMTVDALMKLDYSLAIELMRLQLGD